MTHSPSHTSLAWREISDGAPKDGTWVLLFSPDSIEPQSFVGQWRDDDNPWGGAWWPDHDASFPIDADPTHWQPLPPPPGTEPPQSINSELLEAAKETASFIRNCNGGSRGERINLDRLANLLEVAISNAEKAI